MALVLKSSAFALGAEIPKKHSCEAADVSPELEWSGSPVHTVSFALIMDDPDAPAEHGCTGCCGTCPRAPMSFPRRSRSRAQLADGTRQGRNSFRKVGYNGPCPPHGKPHRYFFRLYALDAKLDLAPGANRSGP